MVNTEPRTNRARSHFTGEERNDDGEYQDRGSDDIDHIGHCIMQTLAFDLNGHQQYSFRPFCYRNAHNY
jgi:hypothetical protein